PFEHTLDSHKRLLLALAGAVKVAKAVDEVALHSVTAVLDAGCQALETQLRLRAGQAERERQEALRQILILGGAAGSLVAGMLSRNLWAIGATAFAEGLSVAAGLPRDAAEEIVFEATAAEEILNDTVDTLKTVHDRVSNELDHLRREVDDVLSRVRLLRGGPDGDDGRLIPVRPVIV